MWIKSSENFVVSLVVSLVGSSNCSKIDKAYDKAYDKVRQPEITSNDSSSMPL